jgi:hypothetical protein
VVGKTIELNETSWEIVGVLPRGFAYPVAAERPSEIYTPWMLRAQDKVRSDSRNYDGVVIGRLRPGVTFRQADEQMKRVVAALDRQYPKWGPGQTVRVIPLQADHRWDRRRHQASGSRGAGATGGLHTVSAGLVYRRDARDAHGR